jgi:hypothetical protein
MGDIISHLNKVYIHPLLSNVAKLRIKLLLTPF